MDYSVSFWNRIARRYAKSPVSNMKAYEQKLAITRDYLNPDMEVMEFGCGTGSTAILHAPYVKHYHAIDVSPRMIEIALEKVGAQAVPNLSFEVSALEEYSAGEATFDAVLGMNIVHLMHEPQAVVQQVFELLKPGGVFVSSTACLSDTMPWLRFITPLGSRLGLIPHVEFFEFSQLLAWLRAAGFVIENSIAPTRESPGALIVASRPA